MMDEPQTEVTDPRGEAPKRVSSVAEQNMVCDGPNGYHHRDCWLDKRVCDFVLACICSPRNTEPCPSHAQRDAEAVAPTINEWQVRSGEWTDSRFPDDNLLMRGLILGEETGEILAAAMQVTVAAAKVQRCILKAAQDIRGGTDHWMSELRKETVDGFFCLLSLSHRAGFSLSDATEECWDALNAKAYEAGEQRG